MQPTVPGRNLSELERWILMAARDELDEPSAWPAADYSAPSLGLAWNCLPVDPSDLNILTREGYDHRVVTIYVTNHSGASPFGPARMLVAGLVDYAANAQLELALPVGHFSMLDDKARRISWALDALDPAQTPTVSEIRQRSSLNSQEYASNHLADLMNASRLPRGFYDFVEACSTSLVEGLEPGLITAGRAPILAIIPGMTNAQKALMRDLGLMHPKLVYIATHESP